MGTPDLTLSGPGRLASIDPTVNRLPYDGVVTYHGPVLAAVEARRYLAALQETIAWRHDEIVMFGKRIVTARQVAWYGDSPFGYVYSGALKTALPWTAELRALKNLVEQRSGATFNSCLLNLYANGGEGMGWHSDDEKTLTPHAAIASLSLGAERNFSFRHKTSGQTQSLILEDGSLLVMAGSTQTHWQHSLPKTKKVSAPRINLTFRTMARARNQ